MSVRVTAGPRNKQGRRWSIVRNAANKADHWESMSATTPELYQLRAAIDTALGKTNDTEQETT